MKKAKKKAKKVKLLKIEKVDHDKHHVHLEVEGAPDPAPLHEPVVVHSEVAEEVPEEHGVVAWFKSLF
jgi:hypothetical protein